MLIAKLNREATLPLLAGVAFSEQAPIKSIRKAGLSRPLMLSPRACFDGDGGPLLERNEDASARRKRIPGASTAAVLKESSHCPYADTSFSFRFHLSAAKSPLRGEERLKDPAYVLLRNAAARVLDRNKAFFILGAGPNNELFHCGFPHGMPGLHDRLSPARRRFGVRSTATERRGAAPGRPRTTDGQGRMFCIDDWTF